MGRLGFKLKAAKYVFDNGLIAGMSGISMIAVIAGFGTCVAVSWVMLANFFTPNPVSTQSGLCSQGERDGRGVVCLIAMPRCECRRESVRDSDAGALMPASSVSVCLQASGSWSPSSPFH